MFCFAFSFFASEEVSSALAETALPAAERRSPTPALEFFACSCTGRQTQQMGKQQGQWLTLLPSFWAVAEAPERLSLT